MVEAEGRGGNGQARNGGSGIARSPVQVAVPAESRANVSTHDLWNQGTTLIFDIRIVNLGTGSDLCMTPEKSLAKADNYKKDLYLQACRERRLYFTPMV